MINLFKIFLVPLVIFLPVVGLAMVLFGNDFNTGMMLLCGSLPGLVTVLMDLETDSQEDKECQITEV